MKKKSLFKILWNANPKTRRFILILLDISIVTIFFIALNLNQNFFNQFNFYASYCLILSIALPFYFFTRQYRTLSRYSEALSFYQILGRNFIIFFFILFLSNFLEIQFISQNKLTIMALCISLCQIFLRLTIRDFVNYSQSLSYKKKLNVAIYGAGENGVQLFKSLRSLNKYKFICFIDDNPRLWGRSISGISIRSTKYLSKNYEKLDQILLAIPHLKKAERKIKIDYLKNFRIPLLSIPSFEQLISGQARIDTLKPISIHDLLGRDTVAADEKLLFSGVKGKVILITGAGGSIGSELCNQIIKLNPEKLILFEISESSLYILNNKLINLKPKFKIIPVLGNACNYKLIYSNFIEHKVDVVFHAAAYKHVPLVETNCLESIANNTISTLNICKASEAAAVKNVVFISSDKAVRPTNIMGATKRLSELIIQAFSQKNSKNFAEDGSLKLIFSMVRFGNVLDSSGSVVPLFKKQISDGGPITLTHEKIIRYFMTIPEASQLVIQSLALAKGGDLFLLDMGDPISIKKLAEQMILLSGQTIRNDDNPDGDIEIKVKGLRPGEKLYEELLIDSESLPTSHPLIFRAKEKLIQYEVLFEKINLLINYLDNFNKEKTIDLLQELIPEWRKSDFFN